MSSYEEEEIEEGKILLEDFFPTLDRCLLFPSFLEKPQPHPSVPPYPCLHCTPCTLSGHEVTCLFLQMQGCYGDLLMLQLPCGKWMSLVSPSGLRDCGQMLQEQGAGSVWRLWVSVLSLICSAGGKEGHGRKSQRVLSRVRSEFHLVSALQECPSGTLILFQVWDRVPSGQPFGI